MGFFRELLSSILLFGLVFGMSATVEMRALKKQVQNRVALGIGVVMQFLVLPFVGFVVVKVLRLPSSYGVILLVITSSPGGSYSNWWCSIFNAELALSVTMTTISTLLSVVMLPLNLVLYTKWTYSQDVVQSLDWTGLMISLIVVIAGIGGGLYSSYRAEQRNEKVKFHTQAHRLGNASGILLVALSILVSVTGTGGDDADLADVAGGNGEDEEDVTQQANLFNQDARFYIGVALPAVLGLWLAVKLASHYELEKPERVAVAVEACYQNTGIATSVAFALYDGDELATAIGVPLYYGIVEAIVLATFCLVCWRKGWTKAPPEDPFCKVISNSYQDQDNNNQNDAESSSTTEGTTTATAAGTKPAVPQHDEMDEETCRTAAEMELTNSSVSSGSASSPPHGRPVVRSSPDGAVSLVVENGSQENDPSQRPRPQQSNTSTTTTTTNNQDPQPHVNDIERLLATVRARAAGYGTGIQDETRGLRTKRGPVTLGLSYDQSSSSSDSRKRSWFLPSFGSAASHQSSQQQTNDGGGHDDDNASELPAQGRTID